MRYCKGHEWVEIEGKRGKIGISTFAQKEIGEIVYVELPEIGTHLTAGEEFAVVESTKAATDLYTPLSGQVVRVNEEVKKNPSLLSAFPETEGWLVEIALSHPEEIDSLLSVERRVSPDDRFCSS